MRYLLIFFFLISIFTKGQIVVDNNIPYNDPISLVDNILLGGGIIASNHTFEGATAQIGWFNAQNTSLGLDSGIILCTGDIYSIDPIGDKYISDFKILFIEINLSILDKFVSKVED